MKLLLDTHTFLWWCLDDPKLPRKPRSLIQDQKNQIFVSSVSAWEISTKSRIGKLDSAGEIISRYEWLLEADGFQELLITTRHALRAGSYAVKHRDPFDRMLAAQAEIDGLTVLSQDKVFKDFPVKTIWGK